MKGIYINMKKIYRDNICQVCKTVFRSVRRTRFCSHPCRMKSYHQRNYIPSPHKSIGRSYVGAANELRVAADLMFKGFTVFRAMSPHASCDLLVLKRYKIWRVEVRTGRDSKRGRPYWPKAKRDKGNYDVLAVVLDNTILYIPDDGFIAFKKSPENLTEESTIST